MRESLLWRNAGACLLACLMVVGLFAILPTALHAGALDAPSEGPLWWPEEQRQFWMDGPRLLFSDQLGEELQALPTERRGDRIAELLADPDPSTEANELTEAIARRRALVAASVQTYLDDRAKLLFLQGTPKDVHPVDCELTFKPLVIWSYGAESQPLILYQPKPDQPYRLWLPSDSKRALYVEEMAYWLEQYHELRRFITGKRFDIQLCQDTKKIDEITGVAGLIDYRAHRVTDGELLRWLAPPKDLEVWATEASQTATAEDAAETPLRVDDVEVQFPSREGQRLLSRLLITVPVGDGNLQSFQEGESAPEYRLNVEGLVEHENALFEDLRVRYVIQADRVGGERVALAIDEKLRPERDFYIRLRLRDEVGKREASLAIPIRVPDEPIPPARSPTDQMMVALGDRLAEQNIPGVDSIVLVPPETDVILGLWRADTLVTGDAIKKVAFLVDGQVQLTRTNPPFTAELRLSTYPKEQVVRVEGYAADGKLVDADELVLDQQRGELRVRITEPGRGGNLSGSVPAAAEVVVPEERRLEKVEFWVNEQLQKTLEAPPWKTTVDVPERSGSQQVLYLTVVAELDNGARAEDVRFLNVPDFMDAVDVDFVELYTTVTGQDNRPVSGLGADDFQVFEDGRKQEIARFELVRDLPLTLGIAIDTSGSMIESLGEARRAAVEFIDNIATPKDRAFVVSFADRAEVVLPRTSDMGAVERAINGLRANGMTALHDSVVTSLYYFRGVRGRRALILLSDGEDTTSSIDFRDALEYARRSGVAIYTVGLNISRFELEVRRKLSALAEETGGQKFFIGSADELRAVYGEIENELRSQYLLAYRSDRPPNGQDQEFRQVEVRVKGHNKARTISGYYP